MRNYLPALLTAGGMLIAILCLLFLGWMERRIASLRYLIGAATFALAQLAAESSRAFVQLLYPAQIVRLELVLLCSCGFGLLLPAYLSARFDTPKLKWILVGLAGFMVSAVLVVPGFDEKTAWVIFSSAASSMVVSARGFLQKKPGALSLFAMLGTCLILRIAVPSTFLDRDFYIWALLFFGLALAQEAKARAEPAGRIQGRPAEPEPLWLGSGRTRHLVLPDRIVRLAAADDYTEVFVAGAPGLLHPEPLQKLLDRLPPGFVRVHRSHAVNLAHLESFQRGRKSSVTLSDQSVAPVSRRCVPKLLKAILA